MTKGFIYWDGHAAITNTAQLTTSLAEQEGLADCFMVDLDCEEPKDRYGAMWRGAPSNRVRWHPTPLEDFPPEFRMTLLLLGVS